MPLAPQSVTLELAGHRPRREDGPPGPARPGAGRSSWGAAACAFAAAAFLAKAGHAQPPTPVISGVKLKQIQAAILKPDSSFKVVRNERVSYVSPTATEVLARPGDFVVAPTRAHSAVVDGRTRFYFPARVFVKNEAGASFDLEAFMEPATGGLELMDDGLSYAVTLFVGVLDHERTDESRVLPRPIDAFMTSQGGALEKNQLRLQHTNQPYESVRLVGRPATDEVAVTLRMSFAADTIKRGIPVHRPVVELIVPPATEGLGIGEVEISVQLSAGAGAVTKPVQVWADGGKVTPRDAAVSEAAPATVRYRGHGLGQDLIHAKGTGLRGDEVPIRLTFPWGFLAAALLGGGLGALVLRLLRPHRSGGALARHFFGGTIFGVLVACLYVLGVNITSVALPAQNLPVAVFAISALGSIMAIPLVSKYSENFKGLMEGAS